MIDSETSKNKARHISLPLAIPRTGDQVAPCYQSLREHGWSMSFIKYAVGLRYFLNHSTATDITNIQNGGGTGE